MEAPSTSRLSSHAVQSCEDSVEMNSLTVAVPQEVELAGQGNIWYGVYAAVHAYASLP